MINVLYLVINRSSRLLSRLTLSLSLSLVRCISMSSQPGSLTLLLTMLTITCHISLLVALCLPTLSLQSILREDQRREDSWSAQPQDFYSRFVVKRDNILANQIQDSSNERSPSVGVVGAYYLPIFRCLLHRYTLMELNQMMEVVFLLETYTSWPCELHDIKKYFRTR